MNFKIGEIRMSSNTFELLSELVGLQGMSGAESEASAYAAKLLETFGKTDIDTFGNVICYAGEHNEARPTILIDAHIDEIGMIVTYITDDGFLKVSNVGGLDNRVLPGQRVRIFGKEAFDGVIISTPPHLSGSDTAAISTDELYIDTGLSSEKAREMISLGDRVYIYNTLKRLNEDMVTSHALDNRAGCVAVIRALEMIDFSKAKYNVIVMLSAQEETGERGAKTGAFSAQCDEAIVVDVSFAQTHGESECGTGKLGKGAMIGFSPSLSKEMSSAFVDIAKRYELPYQTEVMSGKTGTNADAIGISKGGVRAVTVSIPLKNMHTPVEIVDLRDIENTAKLIKAYIEN